jgi:hypothetical protein
MRSTGLPSAAIGGVKQMLTSLSIPARAGSNPQKAALLGKSGGPVLIEGRAGGEAALRIDQVVDGGN